MGCRRAVNNLVQADLQRSELVRVILVVDVGSQAVFQVRQLLTVGLGGEEIFIV
ncbi:hypothetical protein D3C81_2296480 [compost metagenome]